MHHRSYLYTQRRSEIFYEPRNRPWSFVEHPKRSSTTGHADNLVLKYSRVYYYTMLNIIEFVKVYYNTIRILIVMTHCMVLKLHRIHQKFTELQSVHWTSFQSLSWRSRGTVGSIRATGTRTRLYASLIYPSSHVIDVGTSTDACELDLCGSCSPSTPSDQNRRFYRLVRLLETSCLSLDF